MSKPVETALDSLSRLALPPRILQFPPNHLTRKHASIPLLASRGLLLGQRGEAQVGLDGAELGEQLLGLLVLDGGVDDDVVAGDPVDGRGDLVLVAGDERVDDAQDLGRVAAGRRRVAEDGADRLLGVDDEDGADREGDALLVDVGGVLVVDPVRSLVLAYHRLKSERSRGI